MRLVIAQMSHETNTFSPVVTDLARFSRAGNDVPIAGDAARRLFTGTATCMGGFLEVAQRANATVDIPIAASAPPSAPAQSAAYEYIVDRIVESAKSGCDAMLLDLHGAMVTQAFEDGEGELLKRIRSVAPDMPIAVALDMHANLYSAMIDNATVICGYHTYPHVDMDATAVRAGTILMDTLAGKVRPVMRWGNAPMLPHVMRQGSDDMPNKALQRYATQLEATDALAVSLFTGFPHADIAQAGLSVVVVTDDNEAKATTQRDALLDMAWERRAEFVYTPERLEDSVTRAKTLGDEGGPVILLDHYDNTASGGTMDTTEVLSEILRQGLEDVVVFGFFDPGAVDRMVHAGVGNEVEVSLGGKLAMPAITAQSKPLNLVGRVKLISDGDYAATVAMARGLTISMGTTAILRVGSVDIVVVSRHTEPYDPGCLTSLGVDPTTRRFLMLKSRVHYRVGFKGLARHVIECAGVGVCTSDYSALAFEHVRRPIFPLDPIENR